MLCKVLQVTVLVCFFNGLASSSAIAQNYNLYHFADAVPIKLDQSSIAILTGVLDPIAIESFADLGINVTNVESFAIPGWQLLDIELNDTDVPALEDALNRIARAKQFDFVAPVFFDNFGGPLIPTRDILLRFDPSLEDAQQDQILAEANVGNILDRNWANMSGAFRIRSHSNNGLVVLEQANALARRPEIRWAEPDMIFTGRGHHIPNDPGFPNCWGLHNTGQFGGTPDMDMDAPEAWDITTGDESIIVVIIDTGVQQNHPDIHQIEGADFTGQGFNGGPINACDNHGTPVAGCVSATIDNNLGTVGVAPGCVSASARTFISNLSCDGSWTSQVSWTVNALAWAESNGARVTNNSNGYGFFSSAIEDQYDSTHHNGIVHFASAGNNSSSSITFPASHSSVNAIAALNQDGNLTSFSNFGNGLAFSAPGIDIYTTDRTGNAGWINGDYVFAWGTSFASPYSAGVAALILSFDSSLSAFGVEQIMQESSVDLGAPGFDATFGWGFVNAHQAILDVLPLCEPNEVCATACELGTLTAPFIPSDLIINPVGDEDYFRFTTIAIGGPDDFVRIEFSQAFGDLDLCFWNANCDLIECLSSQTDNEEFSLEGIQPGTFYVEVYSPLGHTNDYNLIIDPPADDSDACEPNEACDSACNLGALVKPLVLSDLNFFEFTILTPARPEDFVRIEFSHALGDLDLCLWNSNCELITCSTSQTNNEQLPLEGLLPGTYIVKAHSPFGHTNDYTLLINPPPGSFEENLKLLANDGEVGDSFGAVAVSGSTVLVGALRDDDNGNNSGSAYLFNTATGNQITKLLPNDGAESDFFGANVAISGTAALVGAHGNDDNGSNSGSAYLFDVNTGNQFAKLLPKDGAEWDFFGVSVSISNTTAIVGAYLDDDNGTDSGSAYLFDTITGKQIAKLLPNDGAAEQQFGRAVAISGSIVIIGACYDDDNGLGSGSAYLFDINTGQQIAKLLPNDGAEDDEFGSSVAIYGTTAIVGASQNDDNGSESGSAYLFDTTNGQQIAKLLPNDGSSNDFFGFSVAINGNTAIVGARENDDNGTQSGSAYMFNSMTGAQIAKLLPSDGAAGDQFGHSVSIDSSTTIIGANRDDDNGAGSGSAYLFVNRDEPGIPGDLDGDGVVNTNDLLILFANWGLCGDCGNCPADFNGDCSVTTSDLLVIFV